MITRSGGVARAQITCASHAASIASGEPYPTEGASNTSSRDAVCTDSAAAAESRCNLDVRHRQRDVRGDWQAAIPYVTQDLIGFKKGDIFIVDASERAIANAQTDAPGGATELVLEVGPTFPYCGASLRPVGRNLAHKSVHF